MTLTQILALVDYCVSILFFLSIIVLALALTWRIFMASAKATLTITINGPLTVETTSLPVGEVGVAYSQQVMATGGTPPDTWSLSAGSLPPGLSLSPSGMITGTPTAPGTTSFEVTVTDSGA